MGFSTFDWSTFWRALQFGGELAPFALTIQSAFSGRDAVEFFFENRELVISSYNQVLKLLAP